MTITRIPRRVLGERQADRRARRVQEDERILQTLIAFAQASPAHQPPRVRAAVRGALEQLLTADTTTRLAGAAAEAIGRAPASPRSRPSVPRLDGRAIAALQRQLRDLFDALWGDADALVQPHYRLTPQVRCVYLTRVGDGTVASITVARAASDRFWWNVIALLQQYGVRIRRCRARTGSCECGRIFLRTRRQTFCSPTCAERERGRRRYDVQRAARARRPD